MIDEATLYCKVTTFRRAAIFLAIVFGLLSGNRQAAAANVPVDTLKTIVEQAHAAGDFDGVVLIIRDHKTVVALAEGDADRAKHLPNTVTTSYRLASLTKQVTALLVMQEVAYGKIHLDETAGQLMPSLPKTSGSVTILQLLQHVSGLPNPSDGPDNVVPAFYKRQAVDANVDALNFCSGTPNRASGVQFEYNNCDYIILGAVLQAVTHQPFAALVHDRIIKPLGLTSWGVWPASNRKTPVTAPAYMADGSLEEAQNPATYGAAGALYGNAVDVAKWDRALLDHTLLSPEATDRMFQADPKLYGEAIGSWSYNLPGTTPAVHLVERQGEMGGMRLLNLLLPGQHAAIVIIANTERADLFNTYSKKGLGYKLAAAVAAD